MQNKACQPPILCHIMNASKQYTVNPPTIWPFNICQPTVSCGECIHTTQSTLLLSDHSIMPAYCIMWWMHLRSTLSALLLSDHSNLLFFYDLGQLIKTMLTNSAYFLLRQPIFSSVVWSPVRFCRTARLKWSASFTSKENQPKILKIYPPSFPCGLLLLKITNRTQTNKAIANTSMLCAFAVVPFVKFHYNWTFFLKHVHCRDAPNWSKIFPP